MKPDQERLDKIRLRLLWPVALALWRIENGARRLGNCFENLAMKDYRR